MRKNRDRPDRQARQGQERAKGVHVAAQDRTAEGEGVCERGQKKRRVSKKGPAWQVRLMIHDY